MRILGPVPRYFFPFPRNHGYHSPHNVLLSVLPVIKIFFKKLHFSVDIYNPMGYILTMINEEQTKTQRRQTMANATQIKNTVEENYSNYEGELDLAEWVEMELENMPEGFDCFFKKSWDEISADDQDERINYIKDALAIKSITVKYTDGEFDIWTTETDYQAILKLATEEAHTRGIAAEDVFQPDFEDWMN